MLSWCNRFNICCLLDSQQYPSTHHRFECLLAAGSRHSLTVNAGNDAFGQLKAFYTQHQDWVFGHLGYDLKNELEPLNSEHPDGIGFPDLFFFVPAIVIQLNEQEMRIGVVQDAAENIYQQIVAAELPVTNNDEPPLAIKARLNKEEYLQIIRQLQQHILRGDCYEVNYCQEFYAREAIIDPLAVYLSLSTASPNPFAAFYKIDDRYLVCASPERYMKKTGRQLYSQPMKGTWQRNTTDQEADLKNKDQLYHSAKDRSENVMVVDLVRNDLSKVCEEGSVQVDELFGVYSFPLVHQMISTISGRLREDVHLIDALRSTFPMGSMTGAPKRRVMELIEQYEQTKRGLFSGSVGYITPEGDFDFNVVIRSILYNARDKYLSFQAGSGITFYSDPEGEYEECMLKAAAIKKVLGAVENTN
jgi:para-aminobenzoate synthetase component 1